MALTLDISYMVMTAVALMRVSIAAALSARPPHPQIPMIPIWSGSTMSELERKSTAAWKSTGVDVRGRMLFLLMSVMKPDVVNILAFELLLR